MRALNFLDERINSITMYALVLRGLGVLGMLALVLSVFGGLAYKPQELLLLLLVVSVVGNISNVGLAKLFGVQHNHESGMITSLILFFLLPPVASTMDGVVAAGTVLVAMLSKYILVFGGRHLFNPAAIAVVILSLVGVSGAIWWVATPVLSPFTAILGFLIVRKIRRGRMWLGFVLMALLSVWYHNLRIGGNSLDLMWEVIVSWPLLFFGGVMLTEPLTTPTRHGIQLVYGLLVGYLFGAVFSWGPLYSSPELALVLGNGLLIFTSPPGRFRMTFLSKQRIAKNIYELVFRSNKRISFLPGQYMEWTLQHRGVDTRGTRRYFTIASSPTEQEVRLGVKVVQQSSSFKQALIALKPGDEIGANQVAGDFVLPSSLHQPVVMVAGGIGVTPFVSMVNHMMDRSVRREVVLVYCASKAEELAYLDLFERAKRSIGLKTVYVLSDKHPKRESKGYEYGRLSAEMLVKYLDRPLNEYLYYLSGPSGMVQGYRQLLQGMGVTTIRTDYFPGF